MLLRQNWKLTLLALSAFFLLSCIWRSELQARLAAPVRLAKTPQKAATRKPVAPKATATKSVTPKPAPTKAPTPKATPATSIKPAASTVSCVPAPAGLLGWWSGEGDAKDNAGKGHGDTLQSMTYVAGKVGKTFNFDGKSQFVRIPARPELDTSSGFTVEGWVNPSNTSQYPIVEWNNGAGRWGVHLWVFKVPGQLFLNLAVPSGKPRYLTSGPGVLVQNTFQHVAATYDQKTGIARLYRNGVVVAEQNVGTFKPRMDSDIYLGQRPGDGRRFKGAIDEVAIYNRALGASEIQSIYNAGSAGKCRSGNSDTATVSTTNTGGVEAGSAAFACFIDGTDYLHVKGNSVWYEHKTWGFPGKYSPKKEEPTRINGQDWFPTWDKKISSKYTALSPPLPATGNYKVRIELLRAGGDITLTQAPEAANGYEAILFLNDDSNLGAHWYEFRLHWNTPDAAGTSSPTVVSLPTVTSSAPTKAAATSPPVAGRSTPGPTTPVTTAALPAGQGDSIRQISLAAKDLVYDAARGKIYASVPGDVVNIGNSVVSIDPVSGEIGAPVHVGSEPNQLAISDDYKYVYVALTGAPVVRRINLTTGQADLQIALRDNQAADYITVVPGQSESVAVAVFGSRSFLPPRTSGLEIYDNGVLRPGTSGGNSVIAFASASRLYGFNDRVSSFDFRRMNVDAHGITEADSIQTSFGGYNVGMQYDSGLIYTTNGTVFDPESRRIVGTISGFRDTPAPSRTRRESNSLALDAKTGQAFFLRKNQISAYDARTLVLNGTMDIPGVSGATSGLIRWGRDGLAFCTDKGQVFLVRSTLVRAPLPTANLAVTSSRALAPTSVGNSLTYNFTVTNQGPDAATDVALTSFLAAGTSLVSATPNHEASALANGEVVVNIGNLPRGASTTVTVVATVSKEGRISNLARVRGNEYDPSWNNNLLLQNALVELVPRPNTVASIASPEDTRALELMTNDLIYDPFSRKIYASVPAASETRGNTITIIDPVAGTIGASIPIGNEPGKMAVSDDGKYLYVALRGASAVRRLNLATLEAGPQFSVDGVPDDLAVLPGRPESVAVVRKEEMVIYDNGVPRPQTSKGISAVVPSIFPARLYGLKDGWNGSDFHRLSVAETGVKGIDVTGRLMGRSAVAKYRNGRIYANDGRVFDPETRAAVGTLTPFTGSSSVEPDTATGRIFAIEDGRLRAFDAETLQAVGSIEVAGATRASPWGGVSSASLIRWGSDGLAFRAVGGDNRAPVKRVVLVRTALVTPPVAPADLSVTQSSPGLVMAGSDVSYTLTISNRGPGPATGVLLGHTLPVGTTFVSTTSSQGSRTQTGDTIFATLGQIPSGTSATVTVVAKAEAAGAGMASSTVTAFGSDPNPANNQLQQLLPINMAAGLDLAGDWKAGPAVICDAQGGKEKCSLQGTFVVRNAGAQAVGNSVVKFYFSHETTVQEKDLVREVAVAALAPGKVQEINFKLDLPARTSATGKYLTAEIDAAGAVAEADEANNSIVIGTFR